MRQLSAKNEETMILNREVVSLKDHMDRSNEDRDGMEKIIEDLEYKNKKLVEKLNEFIYTKATEYKERTL
jgi:hypothetical protein